MQSHPSQLRFAKIAEFVQERLNNMEQNNPSEWHNPKYRWNHTLRVAQYGKQIAEEEGADVELVITACLLHDVAHFDPMENHREHGRIGATLSRPLLEKLGYNPEEIDNICYAIASHVDGKSDFEHPHTLEAQCLTDADNIDRFGAYRILQWCAPEMGDFGVLAEKLRKRIKQLKKYREADQIMETYTGDRLFKEQVERQIEFFEALIQEYALTQLPKV
ncbi:MAG: HD domain-containing protein [Anaerolineae bacterium]|nr:HD domain-containing protein [Anaerolineae bacterium]